MISGKFPEIMAKKLPRGHTWSSWYESVLPEPGPLEIDPSVLKLGQFGSVSLI